MNGLGFVAIIAAVAICGALITWWVNRSRIPTRSRGLTDLDALAGAVRRAAAEDPRPDHDPE